MQKHLLYLVTTLVFEKQSLFYDGHLCSDTTQVFQADQLKYRPFATVSSAYFDISAHVWSSCMSGHISAEAVKYTSS